MLPANLLGVILALTSAAVWGAGDFSGGQATRKSHQYQVLFLAAFSGIVILLACDLIWGEGFPTQSSFFWGFLAGSAGALGMAALYRALSMGNTASVAPTSAIVCAALPVLVGAFTAGLPKPIQLVGFALAFCGIWLLSKSPSSSEKSFKEGMVLAFLSGIGFGGFFVFIAQVDRGQVFAPVLVARIVTLCIAFADAETAPYLYPRADLQSHRPFGRCAGYGWEHLLPAGHPIHPPGCRSSALLALPCQYGLPGNDHPEGESDPRTMGRCGPMPGGSGIDYNLE